MSSFSKIVFQILLLTCLPCAMATEFERSEEIAFAGGKMVVAWPRVLSRETKPIDRDRGQLIHFHGAPDVVLREAGRVELDYPIVVLNFPGLSSAYRRPFEKNPSLFGQVLERANRELRKANQETVADDCPLVLSSFSAGYGAVREILRSQKNMDRIEGYVAADSIYASIVPPRSETPAQESPRLVDPVQMKDFLALARLSVKGEKFFLITHSDQPTPYASTTETANYLIDKLSLKRENLPPGGKVQTKRSSDWLPTSKCERNSFKVWGYSGSSAEDHLKHLRRFGDALLQIRELRVPEQGAGRRH